MNSPELGLVKKRVLLDGDHCTGCIAVARSDKGRVLAWSCLDELFLLRETRESEPQLLDNTKVVYAVAITHDGGTLLVAPAGSADIDVWDVSADVPHVVRLLKGHSVNYTVTTSVNMPWALSGSRGGTLILWHIPEARAILTMQHVTDAVRSTAFSSNAQLCASGGSNSVKLWSTKDGECLHTLHCDYWPSVLAFSSDARLLVSGHLFDGVIRVWGVEDGTCVNTLRGHAAKVVGCIWGDRDRLLVTGSWDASLRVWDVHAEKQVHSVEVGGGISSMCEDRETETFMTLSLNGAVTEWEGTGRLSPHFRITFLCIARYSPRVHEDGTNSALSAIRRACRALCVTYRVCELL